MLMLMITHESPKLYSFLFILYFLLLGLIISVVLSSSSLNLSSAIEPLW